ncbi:hypothetical protein [Rhizobium leguminosarum]|uniref:hypothetical protein n=1 Tax=Rhizobium leguminosarum TaxID=384 RepID=UPI0013EFA8A3|nr:hypothetical protein [Rhizobium leguminosarum]
MARFALDVCNLHAMGGTPASAAKNLRANIEKACQQIERASCDKAVVVVNMKNVLDHPLLRSTGAFPHSTVARWAINAQIGELLKPFYENEAVALEPIFAVNHRAAPVVALVAHTPSW